MSFNFVSMEDVYFSPQYLEEQRYLKDFLIRVKDMERMEKQRVLCDDFLLTISSKDFMIFMYPTQLRKILVQKVKEWLETCSPCFRPRLEKLCSQIHTRYNLSQDIQWVF